MRTCTPWCRPAARSTKWCWASPSLWRWHEEGARGEGPGARGVQMLQLISLLLENKPGALMRVTGLLSARGYNIESLTVARTLDPELSRMSIVVDVEPNQRAQVI